MTPAAWCLLIAGIYIVVFAAYWIGCEVGYDNALREQDEAYLDLDDLDEAQQ